MKSFPKFPAIMGILNCTPDSFTDGGLYYSFENAYAHAQEMIAAGAHIIDVGGESTRPGAQPVSEQEELQRVIPVIAAIKKNYSISVSVDTSSAVVMQAAIDAGADFINDVRAFQNPASFQVAFKNNQPICLMHMAGNPATMQNRPSYENVVEEIYMFLKTRVLQFREAGFTASIAVDPGFGFGKRLEDNLTLLKALPRFKELNCPLLVGLSRKAMIGQITGKIEQERMAGSLAACSLALWQGADIIRTHDVKETIDAMKVVCAVKDGS